MDFLKCVINLEERKDRRSEMETQLRRIGWGAQFSKSERPLSADGFPSIGSRGCFLSHLATLKRGLTQGRHIALMEDDLNFIPGFSLLWRSMMGELTAADWSICYPAHRIEQDANGLVEIEPDRAIWCAHFMLFHRDSIATVIAELETILARPPGHPKGGPMHVDGAYSTIRKQNAKLKTYAFFPSLGYQRSSRSDIADVGFLDRINAIRPVMNALRKIKSLTH